MQACMRGDGQRGAETRLVLRFRRSNMVQDHAIVSLPRTIPVRSRVRDRRYDKGHVTCPRAGFVTWQVRVDDVSAEERMRLGIVGTTLRSSYGSLGQPLDPGS